jgi:hypothetical protein
VALRVAGAVLPNYRTNFSKHTFAQPQLLAVVCLMRYEDWTLRKTEVRLAEHGELRNALGLRKAPDHTTLYRFLRRLDERALIAVLNESVRCLPKTSHHHPATVAVDATGLAPGAISTFYVRRTHNHGGEPMLWRRWLKWLVVVDTDRQMVLAQEACSGPYSTARRCYDHLWTLLTRLLRLAWYWRMRSSTANTTTATCTNSSLQRA